MAAAAHASWNLFSKQASAAGAARFVWLISTASTVLYAPAVVVSWLVSPPELSWRSWVFLAGTAVLQTGYFLFLLRAYRAGDLSVVYPVGRGSGALAAAVAGIVLLGERPGPGALVGIGLLVGGVIMLGLPSPARPSPPRMPGEPLSPAPGAVPHPLTALTLALVTGMFIASYTLWDKIAVTSVGNPPLVQCYASVIGMAAGLAPFALARRDQVARVWRRYRWQVLGAGALSPLAYILVLAAMTFTSVSVVAPAREVSVLLGVVLGGRLLGERGLARRIAASAAIVTGIIAVAIG